MVSGSAVAIETGRECLRAIWLRGSAGSLHVARTLALPRASEGGESAEGKSAELAAAIRALKQAKFPIGGITLSLDGQASTLRYNLVPPVPDWRLELIMKYELQDIVEKSPEPLTSSWCRLDGASGEGDLVLLVGLGKEAILGPRIAQVEDAGGRVRLALPPAMSLFHAYRQGSKEPRPEAVLLADIGGSDSHLAIADQGRLLFARSVGYGGDQIDEILASSLDVAPEKARSLKERLADGSLPEHLAASAQPALRSCFGQIVSMLESSITFCRAQTKVAELTIDRVLLCGGSSHLPGLGEYLTERMRVPVESFVPAATGDLPADARSWATVFGAAASQFDPQRRTLDLLPAATQAKREFRERTRFLIGAAALLLLALVIKFGAVLRERSTTASWEESLTRHQGQVAGWQRELSSSKESNRRMRGQIDRLLGEIETSRFTARAFAALSRLVPRGIALDRVAGDRHEIEGKVYLSLRIQGHADDSERKGLQQIRDLQGALEALPRVRWVTPTVGDPDDGQIEFTLMLSPHEKPPEDIRGRPRRRPGRRL